MFNCRDVANVFSGEIALTWEEKSKYIRSMDGNDNEIIPLISQYIHPHSNILEVGCGTGKLLKRLDKQYKDVCFTGIEPSDDMLTHIDSDKFRNKIKLFNCPIESFKSEITYDLIIMKQVLHHIANRQDALKKLSLVLKDNGVIIIMIPNEEYQKEVIPFNKNYDVLGRINEDMIKNYINELPLKIEKAIKSESCAHFDSLMQYFNFMYSIGSFQKIFDYKKDYNSGFKFISFFEKLFDNTTDIAISFNYSYVVLRKTK